MRRESRGGAGIWLEDEMFELSRGTVNHQGKLILNCFISYFALACLFALFLASCLQRN
jgi:hypothetical protein